MHQQLETVVELASAGDPQPSRLELGHQIVRRTILVGESRIAKVSGGYGGRWW